jgi:hypothetical protein
MKTQVTIFENWVYVPKSQLKLKQKNAISYKHIFRSHSNVRAKERFENRLRVLKGHMEKFCIEDNLRKPHGKYAKTVFY